VKQGTERDAILYSVGANATHGMRRTNADKRRAVMRLLEDEEWGKWSDGEIARRCGVTRQTVTNHRASLAKFASEKTYTTKHGTVAVMASSAPATMPPPVVLQHWPAESARVTANPTAPVSVGSVETGQFHRRRSEIHTRGRFAARVRGPHTGPPDGGADAEHAPPASDQQHQDQGDGEPASLESTKGRGPFQIRRVSLGSYALRRKSYIGPEEWAAIVADALDCEWARLFAPWVKSTRGRFAKPGTVKVLPAVARCVGRVVWVLDDVACTQRTLRAAVRALQALEVHAHGLAYVYMA